MDADLFDAVIRAHTVVVPAPLVPELRLHLLTEDCPLWRANEAEAAAVGLVEPWWAFCWPGGQALARYVLDHPATVRGKRVLDFGSGGAVEALAALRAGAASAVAVDVDPFASAAAGLNAELNALPLGTETRDLIGCAIDADVVLAGDVFYEKDLAARALRWLRSAGVPVLIGDPSRGFLEAGGLDRLATYLAHADGDTSGAALRETHVYRL
ncbi:MAG: class I SAM-dependent methyltransferase [Myxococcales bacterium]